MNELLISGTSLSLQVFILLEIAQIKRSLNESDAVEVKPPPIFELIQSYKGVKQ